LNLKISKTCVFSFTLIIALVFSTTVMVLPVRAQNTSVRTIVLSDEGPGLGRTALANAGYGNLDLYGTLVQLQADANPSLAADIITPKFLADLQSLPASSPIFTTNLWNYSTLGSSIAISTDGTVQNVSIKGSTYYNTQGSSSLDATISGVACTFRAVYSSSQTSLTTFTSGSTTYSVFAILYIPSTTSATPTQTFATTQPTPTVPEFPAIAIVPLALALLFTAVFLKQKKPKTQLPL
jgi:hypothetical protein